ncbi:MULTISPECIES: hypothetical protein [unclassified Nonomuraea]|uniref:hypothetical protein n=1 Tax=unclassified Nonomuraea TaxID=2593643 RepID=UPI0033E0E257
MLGEGLGGVRVAGGVILLSGALLAQAATRRTPETQVTGLDGDKEVTSGAMKC